MVTRAELWKCLGDRGIRGEIVITVQFVYVNSHAAVRTRKGEEYSFDVNYGVVQCCVHYIFAIVIIVNETSKPGRIGLRVCTRRIAYIRR